MNIVGVVKGGDELMNALSALPQNLQRNAIRAGLRAGAAPIRDKARELAPKSSGLTAKAIDLSSARDNRDGTFSITVRVNTKKRHGFLAYFHEFGVAPHFIARTGKGQGRKAVQAALGGQGKLDLKPMRIGGEFVSGVISHPGHAAQPFMRPAFDLAKEEAVAAFAARIRDFIEGKTGYIVPVDEAA